MLFFPNFPKCPFSCVPDPGDSPPALLIGRSDCIATTRLNGSNLQTLKLLDENGSLSLDYNYQEKEVCWLLSSDSLRRLRCAKMKNLNGFTMEMDIKTVQSLQSMSCSVSSGQRYSPIYNDWQLLIFFAHSVMPLQKALKHSRSLSFSPSSSLYVSLFSMYIFLPLQATTCTHST